MLMIRLQRTGRKHEPTFRVVLTDSKNGPKSGKYLKNLGWYDTRIKNDISQLETEEIKKWVKQGAKLSVTMHNFLVSKKVIEGKKINALSRKSPIKKEEVNLPVGGPAGGAATATTSAPVAESVPKVAPEASAVETTPVTA